MHLRGEKAHDKLRSHHVLYERPGSVRAGGVGSSVHQDTGGRRQCIGLDKFVELRLASIFVKQIQHQPLFCALVRRVSACLKKEGP
jgi:hypothetical protein